VTMRGMKRTALVFVALVFLLGGCGKDEPAPAGDTGEQAVAQLESRLDGEVDALKGEIEQLSTEVRNLREFKRSVGPRFARMGERLNERIDSLRAAIAEATSAAAAAADSSNDALARADEIARDLAVLEQRYEVHMRRYHER
jgi:chromosome segregation ATPase